MAALRHARRAWSTTCSSRRARPRSCRSTSSPRRRTSICSSWTPTTAAADGDNARPAPLDNPVWSVHGGDAAGAGLARLVQPAAQPGLGRQRLGRRHAVGLHRPAVPRRDARRASRCSPGWPIRASTTTKTSSGPRSASGRPTSASARRLGDCSPACARLPDDARIPRRSRTRSTRPARRPASSRCAPGSPPSTKCCSANPGPEVRQLRRRSSALPETIALMEQALGARKSDDKEPAEPLGSRYLEVSAGYRASAVSPSSASRKGPSQGSKLRHWSRPSRKIGRRTCSELAVRTRASVS